MTIAFDKKIITVLSLLSSIIIFKILFTEPTCVLLVDNEGHYVGVTGLDWYKLMFGIWWDTGMFFLASITLFITMLFLTWIWCKENNSSNV